MIQKIKNALLIVLASASLFAPAVMPVVAGTASADIKSALCSGADSAANSGTGGGSSNCNTSTQGTGAGVSSIKTLGGHIVNIFSVIIGIVAIIMIIYGGFRYITSGGDSNRVGSAKNTLIYAIIGLIIVALAQVIVHYVLNTATDNSFVQGG